MIEAEISQAQAAREPRRRHPALFSSVFGLTGVTPDDDPLPETPSRATSDSPRSSITYWSATNASPKVARIVGIDAEKNVELEVLPGSAESNADLIVRA